ncbi:MAG TPA: RcnB family protein [Steroidobacteraceae bacterium]|jgi:Ni/Co efflux regulator RcnB|nr:RcnB family protein [Steroidobacteraceae bacterium]
MKRTIMAAMVLSLAVGSLALADPPQGHHHDDGHWQDQHHPDHDYDHDRRYEHDEHGRHEHRGPMREHGYFNSGRYERPHGWYVHRWHHGDRLPPAYRASAYVIPDPVVYRLRAPPAGYYWVRVDNNAVLAAVATGVVIDIAANLFR